MDIKEIIAQHLPEDLHAVAEQYIIPLEFIQEMPDLIEMVLRSKSMEKPEEKQSWFNLLPMMSDEQIAKLRGILDREKTKLAEIEKKYEEKKLEIKKKYLMRWQNMGYMEKVSNIREKEASQREEEHAEADNLLENI